MPAERKQPHWENDEMVEAWMENQHHKEWSEFSASMLASGSCPSNYDDGLLRRQVGLMRYQFANAGYDAPDAPEMPSKRSKKPKAQTLAEKFGLKANPNAIDKYKKDD